MSFLPAALNPYASASSAAASASTSSKPVGPSVAPAYKPASLTYFTIFAPALRPVGASSEDATADATQILFYTSRERAVTQDRMLRQIGIAKGLVEFGAMVTHDKRRGSSAKRDRQTSRSTPRSWNIHSSKRRLVLLEVQPGVWIHASIDLPSTARKSTPGANVEDRSGSRKESRDYHDAWLSDEWIEECVLSAWRDWRLLNGPPASILRRANGRKALERALERYFSVWVWSWSLESPASSSSAEEIRELDQSVFTESLGGISVVPSAPRSKLLRLMNGFAEKHLDPEVGAGSDAAGEPSQRKGEAQRQMVVLSDTSILWPPSDAGCFDMVHGVDATDAAQRDPPTFLEASDRADILRRVISHLTGLEKERALIRAAAAAGSGDSKRRSVSGVVREKSTGGKPSSAPLQIKTSSPRTKKDSSSGTSTPSSIHEPGKWSGWGGMFANLGKGLTFKGGDAASERSGRIEPASPKQTTTKDTAETATVQDKVDSALAKPFTVDETALAESSVRSGETDGRDAIHVDEAGQSETKEASGPFQALQQRLVDAIPIQDAGRMWSGAESAFKGLGVSLGLGSSAASNDGALDQASPQATGLEAADAEQNLPIAATALKSNESTATDAAGMEPSPKLAAIAAERRDSLTQPEVDVTELAEALDESVDVVRPRPGDREPSTATIRARDFGGTAEDEVEPSPALSLPAPDGVDTSFSSIDDVFHQRGLEPDASDAEDEQGDRSVSSHVQTRSPSVSTTESSKAFPSISVTSAAWYSSKPLKEAVSAPIRTSTGDDGKSKGEDSRICVESSQATHASGSSSESGHADGKAVEGTASVDAAHALASVHHDFELDGWGDEEPAPFQSFRCFLDGIDEPLTAEMVERGEPATATDPDGRGEGSPTEIVVSFTSRRLLTFILIERLVPAQQRRGSVQSSASDTSQVAAPGSETLLPPAWELLRRAQRILNDYERAQKVKLAGEGERLSRFLHLDGPTLTVHNQLGIHDDTNVAQKLDEETEACAQGHCMAARAVLSRHGVRETFARSNNGKTWVASRLSQPASALLHAKGEMVGKENATYMLMGGRSVSIVDCDNELRRLANEFPSFGI